MTAVDYTALSLADVTRALDEIARDAVATFGALDARQLNWRPDATRWSVAQCFDHLLKMNRLMFQAADEALSDAPARSIWQRIPVLPRVLGRVMIRSQSPESRRKFTAPAQGTPATSDIAADVVQRFVDQQRQAMERVRTLDESRASGVIMTSPFVKVVTYSVLDSWRLVVAHNRRHVEQGRRVTLSPGFPARSAV